VAYTGILSGDKGVQQLQLSREGREHEDRGAVAPYLVVPFNFQLIEIRNLITLFWIYIFIIEMGIRLNCQNFLNFDVLCLISTSLYATGNVYIFSKIAQNKLHIVNIYNS
jgi:hypothetical protein